MAMRPPSGRDETLWMPPGRGEALARQHCSAEPGSCANASPLVCLKRAVPDRFAPGPLEAVRSGVGAAAVPREPAQLPGPDEPASRKVGRGGEPTLPEER